MISLPEFRNELIDRMKELHWKQWSSLGVASHVHPELYWIIDLEPLLISSMIIGPYDSRLVDICAQWIASNKEWINVHRLKRVTRFFQKTQQGLPSVEHVDIVLDNLKLSKKKFHPEMLVSNYMAHMDMNKIPHIKKTYEYDRGIVSSIRPQNPPLLQLKLRSLFGINASAEVLMYLLFND